jgi:hypothetical protein
VDEVVYRYELRRTNELVATGHVSLTERLEVGARFAIGRHVGVIRAIEPLLGARELRLVVQLLPDH